MSCCSRQPLDILWLYRQKRVEQGFVRAGGIEPALDAEPIDQPGKAKAGADHADRSEKRGFLAKDFVAGERQPISARSRDIFGKGDDRNVLLVCELANAAIDSADCTGAPPGELTTIATATRPARETPCRSRGVAASDIALRRARGRITPSNRSTETTGPRRHSRSTSKVANSHCVRSADHRRHRASELEPLAFSQHRFGAAVNGRPADAVPAPARTARVQRSACGRAPGCGSPAYLPPPITGRPRPRRPVRRFRPAGRRCGRRGG